MQGDNDLPFSMQVQYTLTSYGTACTSVSFNPTNKALAKLNFPLSEEKDGSGTVFGDC